MEQLQLKDFLNYQFLSGLQYNEDGSAAVFRVSQPDEANNAYRQNLYLLRDGACVPLTQSGKDGFFCFVDRETVLFQSSRDEAERAARENGEESTTFYTISLRGGEAQKAFQVPLQVKNIAMVRPGLYVLEVSYDRAYSCYGREEQKEALLKEKRDNRDYEVFTKIPFYFNAVGFYGEKINRLFLYDAGTSALTPITPEELDVSAFHLSDKRDELVYVATSGGKKYTNKSGIFVYRFDTGATTVLLPEEKYIVTDAFFFHDGVLFLGNCQFPHGVNENDRFFLLDRQGNITLLYDNCHSTRNSVGSDCRYGGNASAICKEGRLYYLSTRYSDGVLLSLDETGALREEVHISGSVDGFDVSGGKITFIAMKDGALQEVYEKEGETITCLTSLNTEVLQGKYVADYQPLSFTNDGIDFTGWVLLPKDYDPSKKYPGILDIHGGPKTAYGQVFYHEMQVWANLGYFVFFTNPRGSDGRDNEFMDIFGKYGTVDFSDLMAFTDAVLAAYPALDRERLGVTGGSYGGFMTNWVIGHTDRFKCAATQRSISNWLSFYGVSDIGYFFVEDQQHGNPWDNLEQLWAQSPLKYARNIVTPTLFIHSDEDYRCPLEQGLQLYTAMVDRGIEARFVMFRGENHELSRGGKPRHRVKRLEEITGWMESHLK